MPSQLAAVPEGVHGLAVDGTSVFYGAGHSDTGTSKLLKAPKDVAGPPVTLTIDVARWAPRQVKLDPPYVVVLNEQSGNGAAAAFRASAAGATSDLGGCIADGSTGIALDETHAYIVNNRVADVLRFLKNGSGCPQALPSGLDSPQQVAVDATTVFVTDENFNGSALGGVVSRPKQGGVATALAPSQVSSAWGIALDGDKVFVSTFDGRIVRMGKNGSSFEVLATNQAAPRSIAVDANTIYWANAQAGEIWALAKSGGTPVLLASKQPKATWLTLDDRRVYWASETAVMRLAK